MYSRKHLYAFPARDATTGYLLVKNRDDGMSPHKNTGKLKKPPSKPTACAAEIIIFGHSRLHRIA